MVHGAGGVDLARLLGDRVDVLQRVGGARDVAVHPEHLPLDLQNMLVHLHVPGSDVSASVILCVCAIDRIIQYLCMYVV